MSLSDAARAEAFERALRIDTWNDCKGRGLSDRDAFREIEGRITMALSFASAIDAQRAETTEIGSVEDESAVPSETSADAQRRSGEQR